MTNSAQHGNRRSVYHMLVVGSGGVVAQLIAVATTPVITRLYSPESYATWALVMSVIAIVGSVSTLRYELAIVLPKEEADAANIFCLSVFTSFMLAALSFVAFAILGSDLSAALGVDDVERWKGWMFVLILVTGITQTCTSWYTRTRNFTHLAVYGTVLVSLVFVGQAGAALLGDRSATGLLIGTIVGQSLAMLFLLSKVILVDGRRFRTAISLERIKFVAHKFNVYPKHMAPYTLVGLLRERVGLFCLSAVSSKTVVGFYAFSTRIVMLPVSFLGSAIRPVLFQKATVEEIKELERFILTLQSFLIQNATPFFIVIVFHASDIFAVAFGERWRSASQYAVLLSFQAYISFLSNWMDRIMDVLGKQKLAFHLEFGFAALSIGSFLLGWCATRDIYYAVAFQAIAMCIYNASWVYIVFKLANFSLSSLWARVVELGLAGFVSIVLYLALNWLLTPIPAVVVYLVIVAGHLGWSQRKLVSELGIFGVSKSGIARKRN